MGAECRVIAGADVAPGVSSEQGIRLGVLEISYPMALLTGALSFLPPCLCDMTGGSAEDLRVGRRMGTARFRRHFGKVEKVTGGHLVATGILFQTGAMQTMSFWLLETFPAFRRIG